ncbi:MAG: radical SAM protein [bacterium]
MLISWNITKECNLSCKHCYRDAGEKAPDELSFDEGCRLLSEIKEAGFKMVILSGGEPILRKDVYSLIEYGVRLGLRMTMGTNGTLLTKLIVSRLKDSGLARVGISLDSTSEKLHNEFRGKSFAYKRTMDGIKNCKDIGLPFQIHTTIMDFNYREIEELIDFSKSLGALAIHIFFLVKTGRAGEINEDIARYKDILRKILEKQKTIEIEVKPVCAPQFMLYNPSKYTRGCLAGISYCCILPGGDVHPCPYLPIKAGNVREMSFGKLWRNSSVFKELRLMEYKGRCGICSHKKSCGGCRARAYSYSLDYMDVDPFCMKEANV